MTQRKKYIGLLLLAGVFVALILLAASLSNLQFYSGITFAGDLSSDSNPRPAVDAPVYGGGSGAILQGIIALVFIIIMIYVPVRIIMSVELKIILRTVLVMGLLLSVVYLIYRVVLLLSVYDLNGASEITTLPTFSYPAASLGQPPEAIIWIVIVAIILGISLPVVMLFRSRQDQTQIFIHTNGLHRNFQLRGNGADS